MPTLPETLQQVRPQLESIAGVEYVVIDSAQDAVALVCAADAVRPAVAQAAANVLADNGISAEEVRVEVTCRLERREQQRVRFVEVSRSARPEFRTELRVTLEWNGEPTTASAEAERGEALELKAVATASIEALSRIVNENLDIRVAGVKRVRAFDAELMVASLYRPGPPPQQFVGAVVAGDDPYRSACLAVLSALNRVLGNYLAR